MPRAHRLHAPGAGTHITARLQGGAHLFAEHLRDHVANVICDAAEFCGVAILALVIMPNHFHVVAQQSSYPLGWMMQCAMQRISIVIRRHYSGEGHVFGRRYWSCICHNASYLRSAVLYTHLNPWKAGLCATGIDYRWSSHAAYKRTSPDAAWQTKIAAAKGRLLFAGDTFDDDDIDVNYEAFIDYARIRYLTAVPGDRLLFDWTNDAARPFAPKGDEHWIATYSHAVPQRHVAVQKMDLRDRAVSVLKSIAPDCTLDELRSGKGSRRLARIRREVVVVLLSGGYRKSAIARCLFISATSVSKIVAELRDGLGSGNVISGQKEKGKAGP